jgi:hypothetical protein
MHSRFKVILAIFVGLALFAGTADAQKSKKKKAPKPPPPAATVKKNLDEDVAAIGGTGVPNGYLGRTDRANQNLSDAKYVKVGNGWDVTTGPAHILWRPNDMASGNYTVSATINQLAKPAHPEAYGIFIGGSDLSGPNQSYLYFLVRGTGEMFAKTRAGETLVGRIAWQKNGAVAMEDSAGRASYKLTVKVDGDSVRFLVNGHRAATLAKGDMPTNGIYGLRINHNLKVHATPVTITRP